MKLYNLWHSSKDKFSYIHSVIPLDTNNVNTVQCPFPPCQAQLHN